MISSGQLSQPVIEWSPCLSDHVLYYREQLESQGVQGQLFTCPTTGTEMVILIPSQAIKRQLEKAAGQREPDPSPAGQSLPGQGQPVAGPAGHPPPGRREGEPPRLQPLPAPPPGKLVWWGDEPPQRTEPRSHSEPPRRYQACGTAPPPEPLPVATQDLIFRVTNKNRRKLQQQAKKKAAKSGRVAKSKPKPKPKPKQAKATKNRQQLSAETIDLVSDEDEDEEADENEDEVEDEDKDEDEDENEDEGEDENEGVEEQLVLSQQTADTNAWFDKDQQKYGVYTKPKLRAKMVKNAKAIAGHKAVRDWKDFYTCWRVNGQLKSRPTSRDGSQLQRPQGVNYPAEFQQLYDVYDRVRSTDLTMSFKAITYRCRMVRLYELYHAAESAQFPTEPVFSSGMTKRARRKRSLFQYLHPGFEGIRDLRTNPRSRSQWGDFGRRLSAATRWQAVKQALGWGALGLIPESAIPANWIQRGLTDDQLAVWLRAVSHFNPMGRDACIKWSTTLLRAMDGGRPPQKRRVLEGVTNRALGGYTSPQVLFCEDSGQSGDENPGPGQAPVPMPAPHSGPGVFLTWVDNPDPARGEMDLGEHAQALFSALDSHNPSGFDVPFSSQDFELDQSLSSQDFEFNQSFSSQDDEFNQSFSSQDDEHSPSVSSQETSYSGGTDMGRIVGEMPDIDE